jgi:adenylosuccinate synthase
LLDVPLLRYSVKCSQLSSLALTKLDILSDLPELKICYAYEQNGQIIESASPGMDLADAKPLYKSFTPFKDDFTGTKTSKEFDHYINFIQESVGIPIGIYAYGPDRNQVVFRQKYS